MGDLTKIPDYNYNLDLIISQFANSDNLKGIITAANNKANDIETALFEIRDNFYLDTAIGVQLDVIGSIFLVDRNGRTDSEYRLFIQGKAALNYSGEPEGIFAILLTLYEATFVTYRPFYTGKYYIYSDMIDDFGYDELDEISPAGVQGLIESRLVDGAATPNDIVDANGNYITGVYRS
jgi:hypothetical protein